MKNIPKIKNFKSRREWEEFIWQRLTEFLVNESTPKTIDKYLRTLLTKNERLQMIKRAVAISMLKQGKSYREIGELLWLSPTTISALRKSMRQEDGYISSYSRSKKKEPNHKPLSKKEWTELRFSLWIETLFTLPPPPPIPSHPRSLTRKLRNFEQWQRIRKRK